MRRRLAVGALGVVAIVVALPGVAFAAGKVSPAPQTFGVTEGNVQDVVFTLDAPIIGPGPGPADVTLSFTPSDPSRISVSPSTLHWDASEWPQPRTLHVTAIHDGVHDASNTVTVQVLTTSASAYYSGYTTSITATIGDIDPAPTTTTVTTAPPSTTTLARATTVVVTDVLPTTGAAGPPSSGVRSQLAMTGAAAATSTLVGAACLAIGALLLAAARPGRRRRTDRSPSASLRLGSQYRSRRRDRMDATRRSK
jgi:hypothetical protein